jgi:hypothetical protein
MALTILDDCISSDNTTHTARTVPGKHWEVSWLPGRPLTRNGAITAMVLADVTAHSDVRPGHPLWTHIEGWASELGLDAPEALAQTASPPGSKNPGKTAMPADPEAAG